MSDQLITLTFDDGPNGLATRQIVDILVAKKVPATFFQVGRSVAADPATAKYVVDHGFAIGHHSWTHSYWLPFKRPMSLAKEFTMTTQAIQAASGADLQYFRPPHGWCSPGLLWTMARFNLQVMGWSIDPRDYFTGDAQKIIHRTLHQAADGGIVLLHDGLQDGPMKHRLAGRQGTIKALPTIIDGLRQKGFTLVSLEELLAKRPQSRAWRGHLFPLRG